jgi:hypothetical protein
MIVFINQTLMKERLCILQHVQGAWL